jgi:uncharacterized DUF497 family protein
MVAPIGFEWDEAKAKVNVSKHGVSFEEAKSVFYDPRALVIDDPDHSMPGEDRSVILGLSRALRILVVAHCYRQQNETIRIISARKANANEAAQYAGGR